MNLPPDIFGPPSLLDEGLGALTRGIRTAPGDRFDDNGVAIPMSFVEYVNHVNPRFIWHRHNRELAAVLQDVADGKYGDHARIIIAEPPRHGKTEEVSKLFSSYWLYRWPEEWVGLVTYVADLSYSVSKEAMNYYVTACSDGADWMDPADVLDAEAARHWRTKKGGGMWATGIGGPATGKGFNLGIIDDPVKNQEESQSEKIGARNKEWYQSTFYSREAPRHTAIIVMHTRWPGPGDLIGWLLEQEGSEDDEPERWHVVMMPAEKDISDEDMRKDLPSTCTLHPDWRAMGEALCPGRYDEVRLRKIKKRSGPYFWASVWQQRPRPKEGGAFKQDWFRIIDHGELPTDKPYFELRYWDLGASEHGAGGDPTAGVKIRVYAPDDIVIMDCEHMWKTPARRDEVIRDVAARDGISCTQWGPQDPAAAGKAEAIHFRSNLAGFKVHTEPVTGDIQILSGPYQAALENGHVRLLRGGWNKKFIDEHLEQWTGSHDDQVWAAANAYLKGTYRRLRRNRQFVASHSYRTFGV